jgi:probable rRNA maturation factor
MRRAHATGAEGVAAARPGLVLSLQMPDGRHRTLLPRHFVARCIRAALQAPADITVRVVGEAEGLRLNRDFRRQDHATNVLTFDYARAPRVQADLVLCAPVVEREALAAGRPVQAHYAHLLVHGTLHAQGWDHLHARQAKAMEAREAALLVGLGFPDPHAAR